MSQSTVVPIGHLPIVKDLAARNLSGAFSPRQVRDSMVSLYFPHLETLILYRTYKGEAVAQYGVCPIDQDKAIDEVRGYAIDWGVRQADNTLYVIGEDAQGIRADVLDGEVIDGPGMRTDELLPYLDSGENCLTAFYDQPSRDLRLYRIHDGCLVWWCMARPMDSVGAARYADEQREHAGLDYKALHYHIVEAAVQ